MNTFLQQSKKVKIDDSQVLDMLYKKLIDEFKDQLVTVRKAINLNGNLILLLCDMDAKMKKISKQSQLCVKLNASNLLATKLPFKSYNLAPTKPSTTIEVAVVSSIPSTATETYLGLMNVSNMIRQGLILQKEKDRRNSLGLYRYYGKPRHIAIDHKNLTLLASKRQTIGAFMDNSITLVPYKPLFMEENKRSLG